MFKPKALTEAGIQSTIRAYVRCEGWHKKPATTVWRLWAAKAICSTSFCARGPISAQTAGAVPLRTGCGWPEIVRQVRAAVGSNFILMYRHSVLDLVEGGNSWDEVVQVAQALDSQGKHVQHRYWLA